MTRAGGRSLLAASLLLLGFSSSCERPPRGGASGPEDGTLRLQLDVVPGVTLDVVHYEVLDSAYQVQRAGDIDVGHSQSVSVSLLGIRPGDGYTAVLAARSKDQQTSCAGTSGPFRVTARQTVAVFVHLSCQGANPVGTVVINGEFNLCPQISSATINPSATTIGHTMMLSAAAVDHDNGPSAVSYSWTATGPGTIQDGSAPHATFLCTGQGPATIVLSVSDGDPGCKSSASFAVKCEESPDAGGTPPPSGKLTISGHVKDPAGQAIAGIEIVLRGSAEASQRTDIAGRYAFQVDPGSYVLSSSGGCSLDPSVVGLNDLTANTSQDFLAGDGCLAVAVESRSATGSSLTIQEKGEPIATLQVQTENHPSAQAVMARFGQIEQEQPEPVDFITIAGLPAIQRRVMLAGRRAMLDADLPGSRPISEPVVVLTTAVAVGSVMVRFESQLASDADEADIQEVLAATHAAVPGSLAELRGPPAPTVSTQPGVAVAPVPPPTAPLIPRQVVEKVGELQVAASDALPSVVYATQSGTAFWSSDDGVTIRRSNLIGGTGLLVGDPSTGVGAAHTALGGGATQDFYYATVASPGLDPAGRRLYAVEVFASTDQGHNFFQQGTPVDCSVSPTFCGGGAVPDQPMLAADRANRAVTSPGVTADQVYVTWRGAAPTIACSADGGRTWPVVDGTSLIATGSDFPRLSVAADGAVFVAIMIERSDGTADVMIHKFSSCASGLVPQTAAGFPQTLALRSSDLGLMCLPGLDRCPIANYMIAPDDTNLNRVFLAYVRENSVGGDDVRVRELETAAGVAGFSTNRDFLISDVPGGKRYFPWICSSQGRAFVTWYDRRGSVGAENDLTAFFRSSISDVNGIVIEGNVNVSGIDDPQCQAGFSSGVMNPVAEAECDNLPPGLVAGGTCHSTCPAGVAPPCGSNAPCDFRDATPCRLPGESCVPSGGAPQFGDYNGTGCARGRSFMAWASSTEPRGFACSQDGRTCVEAGNCCSGICVGGVCSPTANGCLATGTACVAGANCCTGNCQGGRCLPDIFLYSSSSRCTDLPCQQLSITMRNFDFHTTGFSVTDHPPHFHTPLGADPTGTFLTMTCQPSSSGGAIDTTPATTTQFLGCFEDNEGFWAILSCRGTGRIGSTELEGSLTVQIGTCDTSAAPVATDAVSWTTLVPNADQGGSVDVCYAGFDLSFPPPCERQEFGADVVVRNIAQP